MGTKRSVHAVEGRLVRTSGVCCLCDTRFSDQEVVAIADQALPDGWAYYELRHLKRGDIVARTHPDEKRAHARGSAPASAGLRGALGDAFPGLAELVLDNSNRDPYVLVLALDVVGLANTDRRRDIEG